VAFLLSVAMIALYAIPIFTNIAPDGLFGITVWVAIAAGITALTSLILYFLSPKKPGYIFALLVYLLFATTTGLLVVQSGGAGSPFIAVWMLVSFFAGVFAIWGALPILIAAAVFMAVHYITGNFSPGLVAMVGFSSIIPLIISLFIWREHTDDQSTKDMKKMASELSEVANKSEVVINAIGDGVIAIDSQGVIQLINPAGQEMLGWGKQDALMLNYKSVIKLSDANNHELDPAHDPVQQVLNTNQEVRANDLTINTKTGKKITASLVVSPVGETGNGVIAVFRDVTKEKAEEREQAEFISTASHEMRTPVASIEGYLGLALNPNTAQIDDKARDFIMKAHEAAQHLGRLFQDLLDVSKSEDGRMTNVLKVTDMTAFTQTVAEGLEAKAKEKGLQLIFKPTEQKGQKQIAPVYLVNQDNDHIREVLDNLIENGIKYTPKGEVVVDVNGTDDKVTVSIKDTGLGIPPEDIPHLFQKFYRVDNVDRQKIGGTGLGLYLCRKLAEAMGGRLWVESVYKQGSTFFFELPRISSQEAETLKEQQAAAAANPTEYNPFTATAPNAAPDAAAPTPTPTSAATPVPIPAQPQPPTPAPASTDTKAATTVPRGESLTREQIAEHVRQLQAMARTQQAVPERSVERPTTNIPVTTPTDETPPASGQS
jgi:PAS domain S-box-containing protein